VDETLHDPCVEVGAPRALTAGELADLPPKLGLKETRIKCGFFIPVKVFERRGDRQLDLGPLLRKITLDGGKDAEATLFLNGWVRSGTLRVGEPADKDRVDLGSFRASSGTERTLTITTEPGVQLKIESQSPDGLRAALEELPASGGVKHWNLTVGVDPNRIFGLIPAGSGVVLQMAGPQPRRVRVPVLGNATN